VLRFIGPNGAGQTTTMRFADARLPQHGVASAVFHRRDPDKVRGIIVTCRTANVYT
jgi:ABC-type multidrug transport system ATPase subunit